MRHPRSAPTLTDVLDAWAGTDSEGAVILHYAFLDALPYGFPRSKPIAEPGETCSQGNHIADGGCGRPARFYGRCPLHLPPSWCSARGCTGIPWRNGRCRAHSTSTDPAVLRMQEDTSYMRAVYPAPHTTDMADREAVWTVVA